MADASAKASARQNLSASTSVFRADFSVSISCCRRNRWHLTFTESTMYSSASWSWYSIVFAVISSVACGYSMEMRYSIWCGFFLWSWITAASSIVSPAAAVWLPWLHSLLWVSRHLPSNNLAKNSEPRRRMSGPLSGYRRHRGGYHRRGSRVICCFGPFEYGFLLWK